MQTRLFHLQTQTPTRRAFRGTTLHASGGWKSLALISYPTTPCGECGAQRRVGAATHNRTHHDQ